MHEFSIAQSVVQTVLKVAMENNAVQVTEINLEIGELTLLNPEYLKYGIEVASEGTIIEGAKVNITVKAGVIRCLECGYEGETKKERIEDIPHVSALLSLSLKCPRCGSNMTEVIGGRECNIKNIQIKA
nr:hydrogenase maturation nickel metallochaperone HypA [Candidatus Bathyarchaeota archaeon]